MDFESEACVKYRFKDVSSERPTEVSLDRRRRVWMTLTGEVSVFVGRVLV